MNLTPEEKRVFGQLFREADTDGLGVVTGEVAVKFFEKTRLEPRVLGEVCLPMRRKVLCCIHRFYQAKADNATFTRYGKSQTLKIEDSLHLPALELC